MKECPNANDIKLYIFNENAEYVQNVFKKKIQYTCVQPLPALTMYINYILT